MWIESHQELGSHPKTKRLARRLKISLPAAVGHLHYLWWWTLDYSNQGDLAKYTGEDIADAMLWEGDVDELIEALLTCGIGDGGGFLDRDDEGHFRVHDWQEYAGRLEHARDQNRKKQARWRDRHLTRSPESPNGYVTGYETENNPATVPNLTVPNLTKPNMTKPIAVAGAPAKRTLAPAAEKAPTAQQEMVDALCRVEGSPVAAVPEPEVRRIGKLAAACVKVGWSVKAVEKIVDLWAIEHPDIPCTAAVVVKHGARLLAHPPRKAMVSPGNNRRSGVDPGAIAPVDFSSLPQWVLGEDGMIRDEHGNIVGRDEYARN